MTQKRLTRNSNKSKGVVDDNEASTEAESNDLMDNSIFSSQMDKESQNVEQSGSQGTKNSQSHKEKSGKDSTI